MIKLSSMLDTCLNAFRNSPKLCNSKTLSQVGLVLQACNLSYLHSWNKISSLRINRETLWDYVKIKNNKRAVVTTRWKGTCLPYLWPWIQFWVLLYTSSYMNFEYSLITVYWYWTILWCYHHKPTQDVIETFCM